MKNSFVPIGFLTALYFAACQAPTQEQPLAALDKKSAREVTLLTKTHGDSVYHITVQHLWFNGEQIATKTDTLVTPLTPQTWESTDSTQNLGNVPIYVTVQ
jgi:hypothetical protein